MKKGMWNLGMRELSVWWWKRQDFGLIIFQCCSGSRSSAIIESWDSLHSPPLSLSYRCAHAGCWSREDLSIVRVKLSCRAGVYHQPHPLSADRVCFGRDLYRILMSCIQQMGETTPRFHTHGTGKINRPPALPYCRLEKQPLRVTLMSGAEQHSSAHDRHFMMKTLFTHYSPVFGLVFQNCVRY